jgi:hypothetical protein
VPAEPPVLPVAADPPPALMVPAEPMPVLAVLALLLCAPAGAAIPASTSNARAHRRQACSQGFADRTTTGAGRHASIDGAKPRRQLEIRNGIISRIEGAAIRRDRQHIALRRAGVNDIRDAIGDKAAVFGLAI